jgi:UDP-glucose 4-epimerase
MKSLEDRCILVTGGTGSFGLFIVNRLLAIGAREVRVLSRDEKKHYDMRLHFGDEKRLNLITGDIRDRQRVREAIRGCEVVFQAAALKHVTNCELHPNEAVKTNIVGVQNVIDAALEFDVGKFITVSTDKAVKPVNVMGMTKAIQERLVIAANQLPGNHGTKFCCVRYGNVMSSRGSAIPFFRQLVSDKKPITITHAEMTRFLLTLDDAIDLVMYAVENMAGGEVYIKKAPATRIIDLARVIAESKGAEFKYKIIGMFPGEKLHEILITEEELPRAHDLPGYFVVEPWWSANRFAEVTEEYNSSQNLVTSLSEISRLLDRSDEEFARYGLKGSIFLK